MGRKKYERSINSHIRTLNEHIAKLGRYPKEDTSAEITIANTFRQLHKVLEKSGAARRERKVWARLNRRKK